LQLQRPWRRWAALAAALVLLNASLSFSNVWPTPAIRWRGELSVEMALFVLALVVARRWFQPSPAAIGWLSAVWTVLVIGRYAEVTAPALYGRDVNLYWDLRFIPDVVAMVTRVAPLWLIVLCVGTAALLLTLLYRLLRWALHVVAGAIVDRGERRAATALAALTMMLFVSQRLTAGAPERVVFATPVTKTYARQVQLVTTALSGSKALEASPPMNSDLGYVKGADVFLMFVESYGAVSYEHRDIANHLVDSRKGLEAAIHDTHRNVVSAFVESPTFGGSSWLAHLSLLSGIEVRDPDTNAMLMSQQRDTLVRTFGRRGFRTVALMPGMRESWPEGAFYGFDQIYGADRLAYRGPEFGWFAIPDQFSIDRLDALEGDRQPRAPRFVFFPTISTHFPFSPTPPYQPDWRRMSAARIYDGPDIVRAYAHAPNWTDFTTDYASAMAYDFATIAGYLRSRQDRDIVMIVIGDHQPPAAVSGEGAPWDVPVHVIASRTDVLDRLIGDGFRAGMRPERPALGRMHTLLPVLLEAFGDPE
jgi:phosphoglycerol transferase MdoB-like AlkP superfamily enzyme